jgi:malonyl CoA-acyl carrier protein transacylase
LDRTEFAQPAILTAEIAMWRVLEREFDLSATHFGGHSLGEYTALVAGGIIPFPEAVRLTRRRGALMQAAVPQGRGGMCAVICRGVAAEAWLELLRDLQVDVANRNSLDQLVLSGTVEDIAVAKSRIATLLAERDHRIVDLNVSAPFHSRLLQGLEEEFCTVLSASISRWTGSRGPRVTSNYTGEFHVERADEIAHALLRQISATVQWLSNMKALCDVCERIIEVGPDRPLRGFFKSIGRHAVSIVSVEMAERELRQSGTARA